MKQFILGTILLILPVLLFSAESKVQKYFASKDYARILQIIESKKTKDLYGAEDYRICGQVSFMFGLYAESCDFYQKVTLMGKNELGEEDLVDYAFALIKLGKGDQVLTNASFKVNSNPDSWLTHLKKVAQSRDTYAKKKDSLMSINKLKIDFLPQYGLDYFESQVYYSYSRFAGKSDGNFSENATINDRRSELAGLKTALINASGKSASPSVLKKTVKGEGRIASVNLVDRGDNFFATVVDRKGGPEQIVVNGNLFSPFSYNSVDYACAMPFFNTEDQRLYFCSNMPNGIGGWDIYYSEYSGGKWNSPVNLGPTVNTPFDELFPSISDGKLVFSSEAREGLGGFDNYAYSFDTKTLTNLWPFNTRGDDFCLRIAQEKPLKSVGVNVTVANYFSSAASLDDILTQNDKKKKIAPPVKPAVVVAPVEEKEVEPLAAQTDSIPETPAEELVESPKEQIVQAPPVEKVVEAPKPMVVKNVKPKEVKTYEEPSSDTREGDIHLGNLYYDLNNALFKSTHYAILDSITAKIRAGEYVNIIVWGFTDRCGAEAYNGNLSYQRAIGVVEFLKSKFKGAESKVYFTIAAGEYFASTTRPVNATDRRIEVYASPKVLPFVVMYAYKTRAGETLESVAGIFNNTPAQLTELNRKTAESRMSSGVVFVGIQTIHLVAPGETIFSVSQKYNCSADQILKANRKLNRNVIVAEKLIIPLPLLN